MNSSLRQTTNIIIDSSIIVLSGSSICISMCMFTFIVYHLTKIKNSPHHVALLLTANMYLAILLFCILLLEQYARVLPGHLYSLTSLNDGLFCEVRAYFQLVSICAIYYSNSLQAIYRLCRVVFYQKQSLQSIRLYRVLIIIQWIICFIMIIPTLLLGDFQYLDTDYHCQILYTSMRSTMLNGTLAYVIPVNITTGCYVYTWRKMHRGNGGLIQTMTEVQRISARRDIIVLLRICLLLVLLLTFFIPSTVMLSIYNFSGHLPWWSSQIQWLVFIVSILSVTISLVLISPHVRNLWTQKTHRRQHHHHNRAAPIAIKIK